MGFFQKLTKSLASESGELKKIRMESERRKASKSGEMPKVEEVIDKAIGQLSSRIERSESGAKAE